MKYTSIKRIVVILTVFALLVFVGRIESVEVAFFSICFLFMLVPSLVLLILTAIIAGFAINTFQRSKLMLGAFFLLLFNQALILFSWMEGWTATSAFGKRSSESGLSVIDPQLENKLMIAFWLIAAFVVAAMLEHLLNSYLKPELNPFDRHSRAKHVLILCCEIVLLAAFAISPVNISRMSREVNVPPSVSSDGTREIQLVPINAWIDVNGLVIARNPNSLIWKTVGEVGDSLTEADGGRFVWSDEGSKVYLLLNFRNEKDYPMLGFDFAANKEIDPKSYAGQK